MSILLLILSCEKKDDLKNKTFKNETETKIKETYEFYKTNAGSGLFLREKPTTKSKKLALLPNKTIGRILEKSKKTETIDDKTGYWFKTEYKEKTGWIFSGYTITSYDRHYLEEEQSFLAFTEVKLDKTVADNIENNKKAKRSYQKDSYVVYDVDKGPSDCDPDVSSNELVFWDKKKSEYYHTTGFRELILKKDFPLENVLYTHYNHCWCCCPADGEILYFFTNSGIKGFEYSPSRKEGECLPDYTFNKADNRKHPSKNILYFFWEEPECNLSEFPEDFDPKPSSYKHNLFVEIRFENGELKINKFRDKGIPSSYKNVWATTVKLNDQIELK